MGPMHPYDLILWLTFVGSTIILGCYLSYYRSYHKKEMQKAAEVIKEFHRYKLRYEKLRGNGNPQITIFEQQRQINDLKAQLGQTVQGVPKAVLKEITGK
tara:strand:+ start:186 stop:485 length:300 start_codon:yes stop_codon:yes gene_type:complete